MKRILVWIALVCVLMVSAGVSAQISAMTTIPFASRANPTALSPDNHTLAVYNHYIIYGEAPSEDLIPIWLVDTQTGETIGTLDGFTDWVTDVSFNEDGSQLASFHRNGDLLLWDVEKQRLDKTISTYTYGGGWIQMLDDGDTVLYRAGEFVAGLIDTKSGAITRLFGQHIDTFDEFSEYYMQAENRGELIFSAGVMSPDGDTLATSTANDEVLLWDADVNAAGDEPETLREQSERPLQFNVRGMTWSADSDELTYFDHGDDAFHTWDVRRSREIRTYTPASAEFALAPDGVTVAWADRETNAVYIADTTSSDEPMKLLDLPENLQPAPNVTSLAFTSDGKQLIVGGLFARDEQNEIFVISVAE